jgi:hypothetical protein
MATQGSVPHLQKPSTVPVLTQIKPAHVFIPRLKDKF